MTSGSYLNPQIQSFREDKKVGVQIGQGEQLLAQRPHYTRLHQGSRLSLALPSVGHSTGHCIKSPGPQRVPRTCSYYSTTTFKAAANLSLK